MRASPVECAALCGCSLQNVWIECRNDRMIWIRNAGTCRWYGCDMARNVAVACYCEFASQERSSSHCAERCSTRPRPRWTSVVFHLRLSSGRGARSWGSKVGEVVRKEETEGGGRFQRMGRLMQWKVLGLLQVILGPFVPRQGLWHQQ